ncbi:MAG: hypothetical protein WAL98_17050 [Desulfatiglandaceae bacterium]
MGEAVLGINPFNQPDVEAAKIKARELMAAYRETGHLPADEPTLRDGDLKIFGGPDGTSPNADDLIAPSLTGVRFWTGSWMNSLGRLSMIPRGTAWKAIRSS